MTRRARNVQEGYSIDKATQFIFYFSMATIAIESAIHAVDMPGFSSQYLIFLAFDAMIIPTTRLGFLKITNSNEIKWDKVIIVTFLTIGITMAIQVAIGFFAKTKFALSPLEIYLFYINAAISEESLFRATLIPFLDKLLSSMPYFSEQKFLRSLTLIITSASVFALSHYWVYGNEPLQMLSAFLAGVVFAWGFVQSRNPLPNLAAHIFNNVFASYNIVKSMSIVLNPIVQFLSKILVVL